METNPSALPERILYLCACAAWAAKGDLDGVTPQFALDGRSLFAPGRPKDLARAIDWWLDHPEEKERMEHEYAEAAKQYNIDTSVRLCEQMFREAIEEMENQEENHA